MNARKFKNWMRRNSGYCFSHGDSRKIQKVLDGDGGLLVECVDWGQSPQGSKHWYHSNRRRGLSKRTRQFLAKLRDEAKSRGF